MDARFAPLPLPPLRERPYAPPPGPLRVMHADAHLLVIDKPAGLLSVPGRAAHLADCVEARAQAEFPGARIVHRLDMDTSGVMVLARTPGAQRHLGLQFERRHASKTYLARVAGLPGAEAGEIDLPLMTDWPERPRQKPDPRGHPALTRWELLAREPDAPPRGAARLRLRPHTGRSHQLRVHLLAIGLPILGDALYADGPAWSVVPRLQLHAESLILRHPEDGRPVTFEAPCPF
ncbi:MAG: pseudouridine synthase [Pseudomonadota bacterium]